MPCSQCCTRDFVPCGGRRIIHIRLAGPGAPSPGAQRAMTGSSRMLNRLGRGLIFIAGSVVGGLALAFLIIATHPDLIRAPAAAAPLAPPAALPPSAPAPARVTYADAVQRAAPAVVNVYTARLVTERVAPSLGELFGDYIPRY